MVAAAKGVADFHELHAEQIPDEMHRHLARNRQVLRPSLCTKALGRDAPFLGDHLLDDLHRECDRGLLATFGRLKLVA